MDKVSYALGLGIGRQLAQMGAAELNPVFGPEYVLECALHEVPTSR